MNQEPLETLGCRGAEGVQGWRGEADCGVGDKGHRSVGKAFLCNHKDLSLNPEPIESQW